MPGNRLIIGLDYGTTYTGVSFCETSNNDVMENHIEVITDWPSRHTKIGTKEKVPSEIAYSPEGVEWGGLIPSHVQRHMWTKLELDVPQAGEAAKIKQELSQTELKQAVDIIVDFLTCVKKHLVKNLDNQYGPELWRTLPVTLVITVPAVWSDAAKARTLQAFHNAGFDTDGFPKLESTITTTEPEAAAIYTIQSFRGSIQDEQFAIGDGFIVCDMGGGTNDLISYRVAGLEPTILEEATIGSGDQCGGSFVDRGFLKWLELRLGSADFIKIASTRSEDLQRTCLSKKLSQIVQDFVLEAKSGFSGTETTYLRLPAPLSGLEDDEARGIMDGDIRITPDDLKEMFDYSLRRTYELLLEQIQQARASGKVDLKHVVMVGGFAESPYMYDKIKAFAKLNGLQTIKPPYAWSAVVRGAAAKGIQGDDRLSIKNRKCRRNYGIKCDSHFESGKHKEVDSYICPYSGNKRVTNQMNWLLKKGDSLPTATPKGYHATITVFRHFWPGESRDQKVSLLASDSYVAATRASAQSIYKLVELNVDLSVVPEREFPIHRSPSGQRYHRLDFQIEIFVQSTMEFSMSVEGIKYGSVTAKYH